MIAVSFRYVNPGYVELLDDRANVESIEDLTRNPINGISLRRTSMSTNPLLTFASIPNELYCRYDIFRDNANQTDYVGVFDTSRKYFGMYSSYDYLRLYCYGKEMASVKITANDFWNKTGLNKIWFHFSVTENLIEAVINGEIKLNGVFSDASNLVPYFNISNTASNPKSYYSNFIISDEYISPKEQVIVLPTNAVETDMIDNQDGSYTADQNGQAILQTIDAKELIKQYGRASKVTGIAVAAVPAYRTAEGLSNLIGLDKISGEIMEHNSVEVSSITNGAVFDYWNTNITIGGLDGKQIGWKAAT